MPANDAVGYFLNHVKKTMQLKNDAALARALEVEPSRIAHVRRGRQPMGDTIILQLHELTDMPIRDIKGMLGMRCLERLQVFR